MFIVDYYEFGKIVVNSKSYYRDLMITPSRIIENWWRISGHTLCLKDLEKILSEDFEVLVVGTGYYGYMNVLKEVVKEMKRRNIELIAKPTREAIKEYNRLVKEGKKVIGAFHLTC